LALPIKYTTDDTSNNNLIISDSMGVVYTFNEDGSYKGYVVTKKGTAR
jgi:hypothetical protein